MAFARPPVKRWLLTFPPYSEVFFVVTLIVLMMLGILVVAGIVFVYVAFPHRGEDIPGATWLGDAMNRAADAAPVLEEEQGDPSYRVFG